MRSFRLILLVTLAAGTLLMTMTTFQQFSATGQAGCHHHDRGKPGQEQTHYCCQAAHLSPLLLLTDSHSSPLPMVAASDSAPAADSKYVIICASRLLLFRSPPPASALRI